MFGRLYQPLCRSPQRCEKPDLCGLPAFWPLVVLLIVVAAAVADATETQTSSAAVLSDDVWRAAARGGDMGCDDLPAAFEPQRPPDEADRDRLHAVTLFSSGCFYRNNNEPLKALRRFQRAAQYDQQSRTIVRAVVELAEQLGLSAQRDRYLYRLFQLGGGEAADVEDLAFRTAMAGQLKRSIEIYERLLEIRAAAEPTAIDVVMRWRLSEVYYLAGRHKQAARCAAWVVDALEHPQKSGLNADLVARLLKGPHPPFALFGEFFLLADQPLRAKEMFEKANAAAADEILLQYRLARVDAKLAENQTALARLETCLGHGDKLRELGLEPYELLGDVLAALGRRDELAARLQELYEQSPQNAVLGYALAECYRRQGQDDKAESLYKQLLSRCPTALGYAGLLDIYRGAGRVEALLGLLAQAAGESTSLDHVGAALQSLAADGALLDKLADAARRRKGGGKKNYGKANASGAASRANASLAVALLALDANRFDLAAEFFNNALSDRPAEAGDLLMVWSIALLAAERYSEAAAVLQRGFREKLLAGDDPVPYYYLAGALAADEQIDEALTASRKAAELKSDSAYFVSQQGWVLYRGKRYDEAAAVYEQLLARFDKEQNDPGVRETLRGVRLSLAGIEAVRGNVQRAEALLEEVLDEFPDDVAALNDLGYLWAVDNRHLRRALRMTRQAVEAEPENAAYRDSLGWVLFRLGRCEEAAAELQKAAAACDDEEIKKHLEEVREKLKAK